LTLADYIYAVARLQDLWTIINKAMVAAHLPVIEYIPEWLTVLNQDDVDVYLNDLSLNNEIFNDDLTNHVINQMNEEERLC
jgi:hypothetical protein